MNRYTKSSERCFSLPNRDKALWLSSFALTLFLITSIASAADYYSRSGGSWTGNNRWSTVACGGASAGNAEPVAGDSATICNGHTITLDLSIGGAGLTFLTINNGGQLQMASSNTARTLTVAGNITNAGTLTIPTNRNTTSILNIGGNITNTGTFDFRTDADSLVNTTFTGGGTHTIDGNGAMRFNNVTVNNNLIINKAAGAITQTGTFSVTNDLTITSGTLNLDNAATVTGATSITGTLGITNTTGAKTFTGNVSVNVGGSWSHTVDSPITLNGNLTNNGTFSANTGAAAIYTFSGGSAQTITGTASGTTTIPRLTLNNANGLSLTGTHNLEVSTLLTLTSGRITTNANYVYLSNGSAITGVNASTFVVGNLRKRYTATGNQTRVFEVGTIGGGVRYTPVSVTLGDVSTVGDFTVTSTVGDHPNIANSTLDPLLSINRYWTLTNNTVTFAANANNNITFTFIDPDDYDFGADFSEFYISRYNNPVWTELTPSARSSTTTALQGTGITTATIAGDYQIAQRRGIIRGTILDEDNLPLEFVTVTATGGHSQVVQTNASGVYTITGVADGATNITITPSFTGYSFVPVSRTIVGPVNANISGEDFTAELLRYTITGTILDEDNLPVDAVPVTASGGHSQTVNTNSSGIYVLTGVGYGSTNIIIRPELAGYFFTPVTLSVSGPVTDNIIDQDFSASPAACYEDDFNRANGDPGLKWTVSFNSGAFGPPALVNNRLRMTNASANVATMATLNAVFPGFGNRIEVEFDYYAYGGTTPGADGIAVVFSDAAITPAPGGYGGSLGYAQRNDPNVNGFAGGWIGVGIDEWGNFSNPTEGRIGGPGFIAQAVAIRGSGSGITGYNFHEGTSALTPTIDSGATPYSPPHRYRIIIDHTNNTNSWVSVERDTGSGWVTLIPPYDAKSKPGQAEVPDQWKLSLTGSTGGANNIHELGNLRVCATAQISVVPADHYEITHSGTGITCLSEAVTVTAHDINDNPVSADQATISLSTTTARGDWTVVSAGSGILDNGTPGDGQATYEFAELETAATFAFNYTNIPSGDSESFYINVTDGVLTDLGNGDPENPLLTFARSGFRLLNVTSNDTIIPTQIAGKPSNVNPDTISLALQAVRSSDTDQSVCEAVFAEGDSVMVELGAECQSPSSCAGRQLSVTNNAITTALATNADNSGPGTTAYTSVNLLFGADSLAPLVLNYPDAGQIQLHGRWNVLLEDATPSGDYMSGSSTPFIVRPFGFALGNIRNSDDDLNPGANTPTGTVFTSAGTDFRLSVNAYVWAAADDDGSTCDLAVDPGCAAFDGIPDTGANLSDNNGGGANAITPNFQGAGAVDVTLSSGAPYTPDPGTLGHFRDSNTGMDPVVTAAAFSTGTATVTTVNYSEVGSVTLLAEASNYLGSGANISGRTSNLAANPNGGVVGRFVPYDFNVGLNTPELGTACTGFTYIGQPFGFAVDPVLTVTARARGGSTTQNYTGTYNRISSGSLVFPGGSDQGFREGSVELLGLDTGLISGWGPAIDDIGNGVTTLTFSLGVGEHISFNRLAPTAAFDAEISLELNVLDQDGVFYGDGSGNEINPARFGDTGPGQGISFDDGNEQRWGRLTVGNAFGSELLPVEIPLLAEYYLDDDTGFVPNVADMCTTYQAADIVLVDASPLDNLDAATLAVLVPAGPITLVGGKDDPLNPLMLSSSGDVSLGPGDGNTGAVEFSVDLSTVTGSQQYWLQFDWDNLDQLNDGPYDGNPSGRATFGIYRGAKDFIYIREPWN